MSIENTWSQINDQPDDDLSSVLHQPRLSKRSSHNPLDKIKRNLLINMIWGIIICVFYIVVIIYFRIWQVQIALAIVLIFSLWALYTAYSVYKKINTNISSANSLLIELKRHQQTITGWMHAQQRAGLFIYPVSAAGGFMLGGVIGSGKPVEVFMSKPIVLIALLIIILLLVPACYYLAKWMCRYSFGKHLDALQKNINDLQEEK
ncbi:MAG: hypothetical protein H7Z13_02555 [Ferruginibacter sp.]|nr:hypothetical protein [Ferruginibacter sp.]